MIPNPWWRPFSFWLFPQKLWTLEQHLSFDHLSTKPVHRYFRADANIFFCNCKLYAICKPIIQNLSFYDSTRLTENYINFEYIFLYMDIFSIGRENSWMDIFVSFINNAYLHISHLNHSINRSIFLSDAFKYYL